MLRSTGQIVETEGHALWEGEASGGIGGCGRGRGRVVGVFVDGGVATNVGGGGRFCEHDRGPGAIFASDCCPRDGIRGEARGGG